MNLESLGPKENLPHKTDDGTPAPHAGKGDGKAPRRDGPNPDSGKPKPPKPPKPPRPTGKADTDNSIV